MAGSGAVVVKVRWVRPAGRHRGHLQAGSIRSHHDPAPRLDEAASGAGAGRGQVPAREGLNRESLCHYPAVRRFLSKHGARHHERDQDPGYIEGAKARKMRSERLHIHADGG